MEFAGINYLAVLIAAVGSFIFGGAWYGVLAQPWLKATGVEKEVIEAFQKGSNSARVMITAFVSSAIMAWVLAGLIGHLGKNQITIYNGIISGAFVWFGFVATTLVTNHGFQMRLGTLTLIDGGHWLGALLIQGAIIGAFGS
jgi:hypothetical protein